MQCGAVRCQARSAVGSYMWGSSWNEVHHISQDASHELARTAVQHWQCSVSVSVCCQPVRAKDLFCCWLPPPVSPSVGERSSQPHQNRLPRAPVDPRHLGTTEATSLSRGPVPRHPRSRTCLDTGAAPSRKSQWRNIRYKIEDTRDKR